MSSLFATTPSYDTTPEIAAALLDELRAALLRYVVLPTSHSADAITLWITATHALPAFGYAPRLVINSPEKRCGKSRLLDIIEATCFDPLVTVNASSAAVFRRIGDGHPPTLLIDEADAIFGSKKAAEQNEDLRALINAGHQRNRPALRCVGPQQTPTNFPTFAMVALAGIGAMPDTVVDRAVNVTMRRRASHEQVDSYRHRRDALPLHHLRDRLTAWAADVLDELSDAEPAMPVEDRAADTWEPLVAVADQAGGNWPARARRAAVLMVTEADEADTDASLGVRLLTDVREAFASRGIPVIATKELLDLIKLVEESPWEAFGLDDRGLARRLRAYQVSSRQVRPDGGQQVRGYRLEDFADAFARYLTDPRQEASQAVTASKPQVSPVTDNPAVTDTSVTNAGSVTVAHARDLHKQPSRDGVTPRDAPPPVHRVRSRDDPDRAGSARPPDLRALAAGQDAQPRRAGGHPMTPGPRGRRHHDRPRLGRRPPRDPDPCPGCGRDPWEDDDHPGCEPKDVRGLTPLVHAWPEPTTAEEFDLFADSNPCACGAMPGSYHHWGCGLEVCPFADLHPDDGEQLLCCGCFE